MHILLLETGAPPEELERKHGTYAAMFERLLAPLERRFTFSARKVFDNDPIPNPSEFDGLLITGSPAGVYEGHDWISPTEDLVRQTASLKIPQAGICFGHQVMAQAFGGEVKKSTNGWGVGVHEYAVTEQLPWMTNPQRKLKCAVSHQDQVITPPVGARVIAGSEFCENGALSYAEGPAISFQMHPEFAHEFALDLLSSRKGRIPDDRITQGRATLQGASDRQLIANWMASFFIQHQKR